MENYTKEAILQMAEEEDVEFIRLQFTDMFGCLKNIAIPYSKLEKATFLLLKDLSVMKNMTCIYIRIYLRFPFYRGVHSREKLPDLCAIFTTKTALLI